MTPESVTGSSQTLTDAMRVLSAPYARRVQADLSVTIMENTTAVALGTIDPVQDAVG